MAARQPAPARAGQDISQPVAGFFRFKLGGGSVAGGVRIWFGPPHDPVTGEELDRSWRWQAHFNGEPVDFDRVWPACTGEPITQIDYSRLCARTEWARRICSPMDVCYCTPRCEGAGSGLPKPKFPTPSRMVDQLRREGTTTEYVEQTVGFLGRDAYTYSHTGPINPEGPDAAWMIEHLLLYVLHDSGCSANELDPLDDAPCSCGLRDILHGKVERQTAIRKGDHLND